MYDPNPEITMQAQALNMPKRLPKSLIANEVYSVCVNSLCKSTTCTIIRDSISAFGYEEIILTSVWRDFCHSHLVFRIFIVFESFYENAITYFVNIITKQLTPPKR